MSWLRLLTIVALFSAAATFGSTATLRAADEPQGEPAAEAAAEETVEESGQDEVLPTPEELKALREQRYGIKYVEGPVDFDLGPSSHVKVPAGYRALNGADTARLMEGFGNPSTETEVGAIEPADGSWVIVFEFEDSGYVKDDDKDSLDPDAMLESMREAQAQANPYRKKQGMSELELVGWVTPPAYNEKTNNLQWSLKIRDIAGGGESVNHQTRVLGRRGVMNVTLLCNEEQLPAVLPEFNQLLDQFAYKEGENYAAFEQGDKVAEYGLAALVTGGAAAVAYKSGLLAKLGILFAKAGKLIIIPIVALFALIGKLFGRKSAT